METLTVTPSVLKSSLVECVKKKLPAMIWGPPGIGKSSIVYQVADMFKVPMIDFRANLREPVDLLGVPSILNGMTVWNPPDFLPNEARDGKHGIFLIDELPNAIRATQTALYQLILDFKLGHYIFPPGWVILAAGNRMEDHGGTYAMPAPLKSRMLHFEMKADLQEWTTWAGKNAIDTRIIAFLRTESDSFCPEPTTDQTATANPRTWHMLSKLMKGNEAINLVSLQAAVGLDQAHKFNNYLKILSKLPPISKLFKTPDKYPVPKELARMYAIISILAMHMKIENIKPAIKYAKRMNKEFQTTLAHDIMQRSYIDEKNGVKEGDLLHNNSEYNTWTVELYKDTNLTENKGE